jgi:hypothetical protein
MQKTTYLMPMMMPPLTLSLTPPNLETLPVKGSG